MKHPHLLAALLCLGFTAGINAAPKPKKELFVPMDYSTCGYHASEQELPFVDAGIYVPWQDGDCSPLIQQAIDKVSRLKADAHGHRGAVVLGEGRWRLDTPLRISASGVVLRGMGCRQTVLVKHGVDRGALLYIEGAKASPQQKADTVFVTAEQVAAGSTAIPVPQGMASLLRPSTRIDIVRPCTAEWIDHLGMADFGGGLDYTGWKPTDIDICWDRTITAVSADSIVIDAPITTAISSRYGGAFMLVSSHSGELTECGVEYLSMESAKNDWNPKDEDHCWDAIYMEDVRDCWVRRVDFRHFAGSAVNLQLHTSRITVEDCIAQDPVSELGGWRRQVFLTRGQQTLFQRCVSRGGIHDFAAGFCAAGPNAFVQCEGEQALGFSGSIGSWAAGLLFDIVNIDGHDLRFGNLEQFQFGTGWNTANSMFWQCTASTIWCYSPDADNRCSGHGCWGTLTGNAEWTSSNDHVQPRSLFYHQLSKRLGREVDGRILPRNTNATSSPTVEQAMEMAQQSLNEPRMTMEAWIKSLYTDCPGSTGPAASILAKGDVATHKYNNIGSSVGRVDSSSLSQGFAVGSSFFVPWWSGRVKDNFVKREGKPAVTRFVPGREGTGWTDRIDSVVDYLDRNHYGSLQHNYGLWYDLRRTDHERVRRADGDVWAPFYEQPFARSGQGTAWDGLSRYDLTRPNEWYWNRLREFATKAANRGILLFNHHYFQHNILEAGAHWVDCPWRPVNNINMDVEQPPFPEPVPFAGDKRIFLAEQFYDVQNPLLRSLHRQYIRMCLEQLKDQPNVVHLISAEYTGPLHFTRFWLQTIAEWEKETGCHPLVALSCTRDAQDSIMADSEMSSVVDIIDIRYWHYNTQGLWAPQAGKNMAPRQWMRKVRVGKTGFDEAYKAVREMRDKYPGKRVTFFSQQFPDYGWAVLMAGGSLANVPLDARRSAEERRLLACLPKMAPLDGENCLALGGSDCGYLIYPKGASVSMTVQPGSYRLYAIDRSTGTVTLLQKTVKIGSDRPFFSAADASSSRLLWLAR